MNSINESPSDYAVVMKGITKRFGALTACDNVNLYVERGEIHALLGENGAGKSTLMSVLFGMYTPEEGEIFIDGVKREIRDPNDANALGIGMVHQHFKLVQNFTALENIILGAETLRHGFLSDSDARKKVTELSKRYGLAVECDTKISDMTVGMQQRVEILKMLYRDNSILIFDEPTAVLTPQEISELMGIMRSLAGEGKAIIFITHKLAEIMAAANRCTILRRGKRVGCVNTAQTSKEELSELMVGRPVMLNIEKKEAVVGERVLEVRGLSARSRRAGGMNVNGVSFDVRAGEILCVAGIDGNGQSELVYALTGLLPISGGTVRLLDTDITRLPVRARTALGMAHIPEDRQKFGLVLDFTLSENLALQSYYRPPLSRFGILDLDAQEAESERLTKLFDIRSGMGSETAVRNLSGGNQQKAIIARELDRDPALLIAVQPTRGLDVGAIEYIHRRLLQQRDRGRAVLLVSLELEEVMSISDRIIVLHGGSIVAECDPKTVTARELGLYMAGQKQQ